MEQWRCWFIHLFDNWTAANWIAFVTACSSFALGVWNAASGGRRERLKNRREEFHRRVAMPIEAALDDFRTAVDDLDDLRFLTLIEDAHIESIEKKAKGAQRKLSRSLRFASNSKLCSLQNWDIGSAQYDLFIVALEALRAAPPQGRGSLLPPTVAAIDALENEVRAQIHAELTRYT